MKTWHRGSVGIALCAASWLCAASAYAQQETPPWDALPYGRLPTPSNIFGLPLPGPGATTPTPIGFQDSPPRPPELYETYESRPPFSRVLPPSPPAAEPPMPVPGMPPPDNPPAPFALPERPNAAPPAGGLRQALDEYDRRAGLARAGAVASLSRTLLRDARAQGQATLVVTVDSSGVVRSARVVSTSQDRADWDAFAASLRGQRAPVRSPGGRAVWATIGLEAVERNVTGERGNPWVSWSPGVLATFDVTRLAGAPTTRAVTATVLSEVWY